MMSSDFESIINNNNNLQIKPMRRPLFNVFEALGLGPEELENNGIDYEKNVWRKPKTKSNLRFRPNIAKHSVNNGLNNDGIPKHSSVNAEVKSEVHSEPDVCAVSHKPCFEIDMKKIMGSDPDSIPLPKTLRRPYSRPFDMQLRRPKPLNE